VSRLVLLRIAARTHLAAADAHSSEGNAVKLTLDSSEPLDDAVRVVGALYGVNLIVATEQSDSGQPVAPIEPADRNGVDQPAAPGQPGTDAPKRPKRVKATAPSGERNNSRPGVPASGADSDAAGQGRDELPKSPGNAEVRSWARENGLTVSARGRVPAAVHAAYLDAHSL
jgi:hypothetical protein